LHLAFARERSGRNADRDGKPRLTPIKLGLEPEILVEFFDRPGSLDAAPDADICRARELDAERNGTARLLRQRIDVPTFGDVRLENDLYRGTARDHTRCVATHDRPANRILGGDASRFGRRGEQRNREESEQRFHRSYNIHRTVQSLSRSHDMCFALDAPPFAVRPFKEGFNKAELVWVLRDEAGDPPTGKRVELHTEPKASDPKSGYRKYVDGWGRTWEVWMVHPSAIERREIERRSTVENTVHLIEQRVLGERRKVVGSRVSVASEYRNGWLCFTRDGERRRLAPVPTNWMTANEKQLAEWCRVAKRVVRCGPTWDPAD
jgi:hypothetical protein